MQPTSPSNERTGVRPHALTSIGKRKRGCRLPCLLFTASAILVLAVIVMFADLYILG